MSITQPAQNQEIQQGQRIPYLTYAQAAKLAQYAFRPEARDGFKPPPGHKTYLSLIKKGMLVPSGKKPGHYAMNMPLVFTALGRFMISNAGNMESQRLKTTYGFDPAMTAVVPVAARDLARGHRSVGR